jgi:hypothetical protein
VVRGNGAAHGWAEGFDEVDGSAGGCVFEDNEEAREGSVEGLEVGQEGRFCIQDVCVLMMDGVYTNYFVARRKLTVAGSEGTSPCKFNTIPTSCIASKTG